MILALVSSVLFHGQEFDGMQCILEVGVEGLRSHVMRFFPATTHVMEATVTCCNGVSRGGNIIKETVADLLEGTWLVRSIFIF